MALNHSLHNLNWIEGSKEKQRSRASCSYGVHTLQGQYCHDTVKSRMVLVSALLISMFLFLGLVSICIQTKPEGFHVPSS